MGIVLPKQASNLGFTLVELMVVLVLIGIMSAVMIPEMMGTYEDALLRSTSRDLISAFNVASSQAISFNKVHRVRFDHATGHYLIEREVRKTVKEAEYAPLADVAGSEGTIDTRISVIIRRPGDDDAKEEGPPVQGQGDQVQSNESKESKPEEQDPTEPESDKDALVDPSELEDGIRFFPDGTADLRIIELEDRSGFRMIFRINAATSRVQMMEVPPK